MGRNLDKFIELADFLEENQDLHDQGVWGYGLTQTPFHGRVIECGSRACIAGHVAALAGLKPWRTVVCGEVEWNWSELSNGDSTPMVAAQILGLDEDEADDLFASRWEPIEGLTLSQALVAIGLGEHPFDVSSNSSIDQAKVAAIRERVADFRANAENLENPLTDKTEDDKVTAMNDTTFTPKEIKKALIDAGFDSTTALRDVFRNLGVDVPTSQIVRAYGLTVNATISVSFDLDDLDLTPYVNQATLEAGDHDDIVNMLLENYDMSQDLADAFDIGNWELDDFSPDLYNATFYDEDGEEVG